MPVPGQGPEQSTLPPSEIPGGGKAPLSPGRETFAERPTNDDAGNLQGQPTPEGFGQKPTNDSGKTVSADEWRQRAEETQRAIESGAIKIDPKQYAPWTTHTYWGQQRENREGEDLGDYPTRNEELQVLQKRMREVREQIQAMGGQDYRQEPYPELFEKPTNWDWFAGKMVGGENPTPEQQQAFDAAVKGYGVNNWEKIFTRRC